MWFSSWLPKRTVSPRRRPPSRLRPCLEVLEDRAVPATFTVNTPLDVLGHANGLLSLRQAIIDANSTPNADTIVLPAGTYIMTRVGAGEDACLTGDFDIKAPLTINGAGAGSTIVDAAGVDRVFDIHSTSVTLAGMTIQGGSAAMAGSYLYLREGGGIYNSGSLTVNNCVVSGNSAAYGGGGIFNGGTLTVNNSVISGNSAKNYGGGIYNYSSFNSLTVSNSTLSSNHAAEGGAIYNFYGTVTVQYCTLSSNSATYGGGIFNEYGTFTVISSTFSGDSASYFGGAIFNGGTMKVVDSTLSGNSASYHGGGINNTSAGKLTISGSTVLNNTAPAGADLFNSGLVSISNSTIGVIGP